MPHKRSMRSVEAVEDAVEAEEAATDVEPAVGVNLAEARTTSSLGEPVEANHPNIRGLSTLTCHLETGKAARCTSAGADPPFSVPNRAHAPGRMCSNKNETVTSPAFWIINY